jgi:C_GCAxxG_C_C family probable redox protein
MSKYLERAKALRNDPNVHYNCAQAVLMAFCEEKGLSSQIAADLTANFGSGMRIGGVCGAMSGGLLVLGLYGVSDTGTVMSYWKQFQQSHDGMTQCRDLLRVNAEKGAPKKQHCDDMVYEAVRITENLLRGAGKIA